MLLNLSKSDSHIRVSDKDLIAKITKSAWDHLGVLRQASVDVLVDFLSTLTLEWSLSTGKFNHKHSETPYICLVTMPVCD